MDTDNRPVYRGGAEPAGRYYCNRIDDLAMHISGLTDGAPLSPDALRRIRRYCDEVMMLVNIIERDNDERR